MAVGRAVQSGVLPDDAARAGRSRVTWDPVKEVFTGASSDLNAKLDVPYLNGWKLEG